MNVVRIRRVVHVTIPVEVYAEVDVSGEQPEILALYLVEPGAAMEGVRSEACRAVAAGVIVVPAMREACQ